MRLLYAAPLALVVAAGSPAPQGPSPRTGIYSSMSASRQGTGDIGGTEIFVLHGVDKTFVLFQDAEGAPGYPVLVEAVLTDSTLSFDLRETILGDLGQFTGRFARGRLVGSFTGSRHRIDLARGKSFWQ